VGSKKFFFVIMKDLHETDPDTKQLDTEECD